MDRFDRIAHLRRGGYSLRGIAADLGVRVSIVSRVVHGKSRSHRVARHIADLLAMPMSAVWEDAYTYTERKKSAHSTMSATATDNNDTRLESKSPEAPNPDPVETSALQDSPRSRARLVKIAPEANHLQRTTKGRGTNDPRESEKLAANG
ncbi:MAG: hypothetical protein GC151_14005 [Betaproteobacteria bacterium]|nr:hypothetical protein [Betaproteobacteria bacterium]